METTTANDLINQLTAKPTAKEIFVSRLQTDDVYVPNSIVPFSTISTIPTRKGLDNAIISNGKIVNVVSNQYGHLPNDVFFKQAEQKLIDAGMKFATRSINRDDRSFVVDFILNDDKYVIKVKNGLDKISPMIRLTNSYDGSNKTSGHFGFYREVCTNGLHVAQSQIKFNLKHRGNILELVMPQVNDLVHEFMSNEYYDISKKFEVLAETVITDLEGFVRLTVDKINMFKFEKSEKNAEPSLNARMVLDIINKESKLFGAEPTLWNGYNAFNEVLHTKLKKTFEQQKNIDAKLFEAIYEMA
jgi:hypothetical protein